jgi:pimeloyl-ACP methyl ester carboxylesterase
MRLFAAPILGDLLSPFLVGSRRLLRRRMMRVYDRHSWQMDERRLDARHLPLRTKGTHRALIRTVRRWDAERIQREAPQITQPTLLIWGQDDQDVPVTFGQQLQESIPDSRLIVFRNCGHLPHEEYPGEFVSVVSRFLKAEDASNEDRVTATA